jgi:hypothetical protein
MMPCVKDPAAWDTYRVRDGVRGKSTRAEIQAAIDACRTCPFLAACRDLEPSKDTVQAGIIYTGSGKPIGLVKFLSVPPQMSACGTARGTVDGAGRHAAAQEELCGPCRRVRAKQVTGRRATECRKGHPRAKETTRLDSAGRRICLVCRPDCAPAPEAVAA